MRDAALAKPNLVAYRDRMMKTYFPEIAAPNFRRTFMAELGPSHRRRPCHVKKLDARD